MFFLSKIEMKFTLMDTQTQNTCPAVRAEAVVCYKDLVDKLFLLNLFNIMKVAIVTVVV